MDRIVRRDLCSKIQPLTVISSVASIRTDKTSHHSEVDHRELHRGSPIRSAEEED